VEAGAGPLRRGVDHNCNLARGHAGLCLVLDVDLALEPDALATLEAEVDAAPEDTAAWELRQAPFEHPKDYDPVTGQTGWCSDAAVLVRRGALEAVGGFDERFALGGADVDLSWRLRDAGVRLLYAPRAVAARQATSAPDHVRPEALYGATLGNLCLRARYGTPWPLLAGLLRYLLLVGARERFPGQRRGLIRNLVRYLRLAPALRRSPRLRRLEPSFHGWDYGPIRDGAGHPVPAPSSRGATPRVSVLVRTANRPALLREALRSISRQTYPNLEVVVVEDGPPQARELIAREFAGLDAVYRAVGARAGRCVAGNLAMSLASGEYFVFLDDDDLLYADHVEVLVGAVQREGTRAAYALAIEVPTAVESWDPYRYTEIARNACVVHRQPFSRAVLWRHNYLPIQSVLFHRSLYEELGGFDPAIEKLEDWNLWIRYSLAADFTYVPKLTSRYRVPADADVQARRYQEAGAFVEAARRAEAVPIPGMTPEQARQVRKEMEEARTVVAGVRAGVRRWLFRSALGQAAYQRVRDAYRRMRGLPGRWPLHLPPSSSADRSSHVETMR
jgi:GT2 family glycosyltransferase